MSGWGSGGIAGAHSKPDTSPRQVHGGGWGGGGIVSSSVPPQAQHHGGGGIGGFFSNVGHWVGSKAGLAGHDLAAMPGGFVQLGQAAAHDAAKLSTQIPGGNSPSARRMGRGKYELPGVGKAFVQSTEENLRHPLRDPFATGLTVAPVVGWIGKLGEAGLAARAAEVASGESRLGAAAKALVGKEAKLNPRTLKMGKEEVALPPSSGNAAVRLAQRYYAHRLQHALDTNPEGRLAAHAAKRIGGSLAETARYQSRMREVPAHLLEHAGRELRGKLGKHLPFTGAKAAEAALRLTSENSTAEEAAAFHRAQAAAGVGRSRNLKMANLYDHITKHELVKQDEHGNVVVNAAKYPKLAEADAALARAQRDAERIVHEHGLMTDEGAQARVNAPAAIRVGAHEEQAAQARLAVLDKQYHALLEQIVPHVSPYERVPAKSRFELDFSRLTPEEQAKYNIAANADRPTPSERALMNELEAKMRVRAPDRMYSPEQLRRNFENSRAGKGKYRALTKQPTVRAEELALAEERLHNLIEQHPNEPGVAEARHLIEERSHLQDLLNRHGEASMFGEPAPAVREGRGYVPYKITEPKAARSPIARSGSSVVGKAKSPISSQEFTGKGLAQGMVPDNTTGAVARHLRQLYRYVNTDAFRRKVLGTGSETKRSARDILVREPDQPEGKIPLSIERDLGRKNITLDELEGHRQALADRIRSMIPGYNPDALKPSERFRDSVNEANRYGIGEKAPKGFKWVDRNALGDVGNAFAFSRGGAGRFADTVNSAVTLATVYLKPGHLPQRTLTNATTVLFQTSLNPLALKDAVTLFRKLNHEDRMRALGAAGQGGYEAMPHEGAGFIGKQAAKGANWWTKHVDAPFRFANIAYEARKAGYRTPAEFRRFLHVLEQPERFPKDEALRAENAAKEANRAGIAYDRMSDAERRTVGRVVWFYPWLRNSTLYTGRVLVNHPYKASIMAIAGREGRKQQQNVLGDLPSYEQGLVPLGHGKVTDIGRLFPFSTAADVLQIPSHTNAARSNLNPVYGSLVDLLTQSNSFGGHTQNPGATSLEDLLASMPETQIVQAFRNRHKDQSSKMFPNSGGLYGMEDPALRALLGSWFPREINKAEANSSAAREASGR